MEKMYFVTGYVKKMEEKTATNGNNFVKLFIVDNQNVEHQATCFDDQKTMSNVVIGAGVEECGIYKFKFSTSGIYTNIIGVEEPEPSIKSYLETQLTNIGSNPQPEQSIPVQKTQPTFTKTQKETSELYITLNGKTYVTHQGLLNEAHKMDLESISTELVEFKDQEFAVVKATAKTKDGKSFTGYGDATKDNVNSMIVKHLLRMAETRAINRSLRLLTNVGMTSIDELESGN